MSHTLAPVNWEGQQSQHHKLSGGLIVISNHLTNLGVKMWIVNLPFVCMYCLSFREVLAIPSFFCCTSSGTLNAALCTFLLYDIQDLLCCGFASTRNRLATLLQNSKLFVIFYFQIVPNRVDILKVSATKKSKVKNASQKSKNASLNPSQWQNDQMWQWSVLHKHN